MNNDLISRSHFDDRVRLAAGPDADLEYSADFLDGIKVVLYMLSTEPAAPREMTAVEYLQTMRLICEDGRNCGKCPLSYNNNGAGINCQDFAAYLPEEAVALVKTFAQEHPERSEK